MRKPLTMEDAEAIGGLSSVETAVPFLDVSNNFFGGKITVTGKNGKTSSVSAAAGQHAGRRQGSRRGADRRPLVLRV